MQGFLLPAAYLLAIVLAGCGGSSILTHPTPAKKFPFQAAHTQQWVTQFGTGTIFHPDPNTSGLAGDTLTGVAVDPQGNIGVSVSTLGSFPGYNFPLGGDAVVKLDSKGTILWIQEFGTNSGDFLQAISSDSSGNFYIGGETMGAFPGYSNPSQGIQLIVAKFDGSGNRIWLRQFQPFSKLNELYAIASDSAGHVIAGGFGDNSSDTSNQQIFIASLDASTGKQLWLKQFGPGESLNSIAVNSSGDIFVAGTTTGAFPYTAGSPPEPFIVKLNGHDGSLEWVQQLQTQFPGGTAGILSVAATPQGNVIAGGLASNKGGAFVVGGVDPSDSGLLVKLDGSTGNVIWVKQFNSGLGDEVTSVAVDPQGNVLAAGMTNGVLAPGFSQPEDESFLLKFNASGENIWAQQIGLGPIEIMQGLISTPQTAVDPSGNGFLGFVTQGTFPGASNPNNAVEMFVAKFGP